MSGVEVAGLFLAVVPLFISAAEHYSKAGNFVKKAIKKEQFAARFKDELNQQKALLILYLKGVVGRTDLPALTQHALVSDPTSQTWKEPDVAKQIATELADAYQPFLQTVTRMCGALSGLIKDDTGNILSDVDIVQQLQDLCLEQTQISGADAKRAKLLERLKFSWKSNKREEILIEVKECTKILERLSSAATNAKPFVRKQQSRRVHAVYEHREVMQRLFEILQNACKCSRADARDVGLRLQIHADDPDNTSESTFEMMVFISQNVICELSAKIARAATKEPQKKKVRISAPDPHTGSSSNSNRKVLEDICKEVARAHACQSCLQLIVDKNEKVYCSPLQSKSQTSTQSSAQQVLSLTDVMSRMKLYDRKRWLHREKSILAIILAYSLLQLHDSSWSQSQWNSDNITFIDDGLVTMPQSNAGVHLQLRRPYTRSQVTAGNTAVRPQAPRRNAHLNALGVVLLELYLNRSIQSDVIASGTQDFRTIAQDLLEDHADDISMTPEYLSAVRFCLSPRPSPSGSYSFEDEGFRELYYKDVIAMLEENLTSRFEVSESDWLKGK